MQMHVVALEAVELLAVIKVYKLLKLLKTRHLLENYVSSNVLSTNRF